MMARDPKRTFSARPSDPEAWVRTPEPAVSVNGSKADCFTARLTIDVTPELRGRIKVAAFQRGVTAAEMLREILGREFPGDAGGTA
jgi:hypothetical protein